MNKRAETLGRAIWEYPCILKTRISLIHTPLLEIYISDILTDIKGPHSRTVCKTKISDNNLNVYQQGNTTNNQGYPYKMAMMCP